MNEEMTTQQIYDQEYIPYSIKWGRLTSLIGVAASFFPVVILSFVFKVVPALDAIAAAATIRISGGGGGRTAPGPPGWRRGRPRARCSPPSAWPCPLW